MADAKQEGLVVQQVDKLGWLLRLLGLGLSALLLSFSFGHEGLAPSAKLVVVSLVLVCLLVLFPDVALSKALKRAPLDRAKDPAPVVES